MPYGSLLGLPSHLRLRLFLSVYTNIMTPTAELAQLSPSMAMPLPRME